MQFEKMIRDGKVAILVSHGYGAGWSTWNSGPDGFFESAKVLVEAKERNASAEEVEEICNEFLDEDYTCCLGWGNVEIHWLEKGTPYRIDEYDGAESLITSEQLFSVA